MRPLHAIAAIVVGAALAGCVQSENVAPSASPSPLDGLRVPTSSEVLEVRGEVGLPAQGTTLLPGSFDDQPLEVPAGALMVVLNLTWDAKGPNREASDLDLFVRDQDGKEIGRAASLADPEVTSIRLTPKVQPGTWTLRVVNFNNPPTAWAIVAEVVR